MNLHAKTNPLESLAGTTLRPGIPKGRPIAPLGKFDLMGGARIKPTVETDTRIQQEAQRFVAQAFYGTLLKQMHDSPFRSELWSGGRGGQAFSSLHDQHLIDRMSRASAPKLTRSLVRKLQAKKAYEKTRTELPAQKPENQELGRTFDHARAALAAGRRPTAADASPAGN